MDYSGSVETERSASVAGSRCPRVASDGCWRLRAAVPRHGGRDAVWVRGTFASYLRFVGWPSDAGRTDAFQRGSLASAAITATGDRIIIPPPPKTFDAFCVRVSASVSLCVPQKPCEHHISKKPMKVISPNFGHRCRLLEFTDVLIRFWGQKVKVTAGGGITVDVSPSSSI